MDEALAAAKEASPGDIMCLPGPFDLINGDEGQLDLAILKKRGEADQPMLDAQLSICGIWLADVTMKVASGKLIVHVHPQEQK